MSHREIATVGFKIKPVTAGVLLGRKRLVSRRYDIIAYRICMAVPYMNFCRFEPQHGRKRFADHSLPYQNHLSAGRVVSFLGGAGLARFEQARYPDEHVLRPESCGIASLQ